MKKERGMVFEERKSDVVGRRKSSPAMGFLFVAILFFIAGFLVGSMDMFKLDKGGEVVEPVEEEQAEETREPAPEPVQDTAVEQEVYNYEEYGTIFIATLPPIAEVYVDSNYIGQTNVTKLRGPLGTHLWRFVREGSELEKEITLKPGENPPLLLRFQE